jgi:enamine deaminase RidA (YjgF/YER057c/UK114 family)
MTAVKPMAYSQLSPSALVGLPIGGLLGAVCVSQLPAAWHDELPVQNVLAPLLGHAETAACEVWYSSGPCHSDETAGIHCRCDGHVLYGVIDLDETVYYSATLPSSLQQATEDAYQRIFALLDREAYPHLWRVWTYFADINRESTGLERYRQFNAGRQHAFITSSRLTQGQVPAASVLGVRSSPLTIAFMAGRTAPVPIENPRQVSAYHYPRQYGPSSPTFSRAVLAYPPARELLFISGTASIVGHQTMHAGDVAGQTHETITNIRALLAAANRQTRTTTPYVPDELGLRVYIRHDADYPSVRDIVTTQFGEKVAVIYLQADVCRSDLLVEIEAFASHGLEND